MIITIEKLKSEYHWLAISPVGKNLDGEKEDEKDENEEINVPVCSINESNFEILLNVIRFWGIIDFSFELLDEFKKFDHKQVKFIINKTIIPKEERNFYKKISIFILYRNNKKLCNFAVKYEYFDILLYCSHYSHYSHYSRYYKNWNVKTFKLAAKTGNVKIMEYLYNNGCIQDASAHWAIARNGKFKCLKFITSNLSKNSYRKAINEGLVDCFKYIQTKYPIFNENMYRLAILARNLEILEYLHQKNYPYKPETLLYSVFNGYLEILEFFVENNYSFGNINVIARAAEHGQLETMKYLYEKGFELTDDICYSAKDHFECLKYAREIGCEWGLLLTEGICTENFKCLKFAYEGGCPFNEYSYLAVYNGGLECLEFFYNNGYTKNPKICKEITYDIQLLKYAHEHGFVWDSNTCYMACSGGNLECLQYVHEHGCYWNEDVWNIENLSDEIIQYLLSNEIKGGNIDITADIF